MPISRLLGLVLLLLAVSLAEGLTEGEKQALEYLQRTWPGLQLVTPAWNRSVDTACDVPVFYGLACSNESDPHVTKLYVAKTDYHRKLHIYASMDNIDINNRAMDTNYTVSGEDKPLEGEDKFSFSDMASSESDGD